MDDADRTVHLMAADAGASRVFIGVSRDLRPLMCFREPTRDAAIVLSAVGHNDDCMAR